MTFRNLLCLIGIHHIPDEKRRVTAFGWYGYCTHCRTKKVVLR